MASKKGKGGAVQVPLPKPPVMAASMQLVNAGIAYQVGNIVRFGPATYGDRPAFRVDAVSDLGQITRWTLYSRGEFSKVPHQLLTDTTTGISGTGAAIKVIWVHKP